MLARTHQHAVECICVYWVRDQAVLCQREALLNFCRSIDTDIYASTNESTILPSRLGSGGMDRPRAQSTKNIFRQRHFTSHAFAARFGRLQRRNLDRAKRYRLDSKEANPEDSTDSRDVGAVQLKICDRNCNCRDTSERSFWMVWGTSQWARVVDSQYSTHCYYPSCGKLIVFALGWSICCTVPCVEEIGMDRSSQIRGTTSKICVY